MPEILIVYASTNGQAAKVAARIADTLERGGARVHARDVAAVDTLRLRDYDGVIAGGSVHMGSHQSALVHWARDHAATLSSLPSAFFSLSLAAADGTDASRATTAEFIDDFLADTGWTPRLTAAFAGALRYSEYDLPTRMFLRLMMARHGHDTEPSRDYEFTDWDAVDAFARRFAAVLDRQFSAR